MALEDRCSPQSAPSPPGIPHSPQSTYSPLILDMSLNGQNSPNSNYSSPCGKHQNNIGTTEILNFDSKMTLPMRNYDRMSPPYSDGTATIKEEEDSIISDQENDHDHESTSEDQLGQQPPPLPVISFSITNILSDRFGKKHSPPEKKANLIFRPFEVTKSNVNTTNNVNDRTSAFTRLTTEAIDYSRTNTINIPHHHSHAAMIVERANFLNCFNPAAYPRIHEEILNSTKKFKQHQHHIHHHQSQINDLKIPPLGSLCKTVSQIGQPLGTTTTGICLSSPPPTSSSALSSASPSSSSSITSPAACRLPNSPQPVPPQQSISRDSGMESSDDTRSEAGSTKDDNGQPLWPAWVYCTRYSDRPSSGPRYRRPKKPKDKAQVEEKRPRTAFSSEQLARLKREFNENRYLTERRRQQLSAELGLNEAQIKIWFQNKRAKIKKASGTKNPLALQLMAQGLYNHSTVPLTKEEEELEMRMNGQL